jgi:ubiquitin C-terminal hydrolase
MNDGSHDLIVTFTSLAGGHYVAFAKNSSRNSWFEFNDTRVRPVNADTVQDAEGYVLFYRCPSS